MRSTSRWMRLLPPAAAPIPDVSISKRSNTFELRIVVICVAQSFMINNCVQKLQPSKRLSDNKT